MSQRPKTDPKLKFRSNLRRNMMRGDLRDSLASIVRLYISANLDKPVTREELRVIWEEALQQVKVTD